MAVLVHILITMVAVWLTTLLPGITLGGRDTPAQILTVLAVAVVFGLVNVVLKPIAKTLGCLLYVLTLGLFGLVVNALLLWLTSYLAGELGLPFHVDGFWPAFWGALIITIVSSALHGVVRRTRTPGEERPRA
ncbi:putative membrane protein [Saccharopolyspora erythraea NRRL 2338]|uniref:Membrane protein n=2 Tax=Saccharopolyspora erythraea TaxID=1836 RepID=A4FB35_SACEN|nr:phage holin family protein [Saccharopolyspora erythraea]EQD82950.1 membrane protein [Saccharopolyspora erythraea D]PFG95042.1 putative membrane protein [Saccharopolyspora erythraea NRRL 2338]QRK91731.1 phage holin family protein [Saccharopolyspora erythraea]CAM01260.1 putative membrane protein [Saccharopolyspora erythraea NRRL 2338]